MGTACIVLDTHIFLKGLSGFSELNNGPSIMEYAVKVCRHIRDNCHYRIAINSDILDEYTLIAPRRRISRIILRDIIDRLRSRGKIEEKGKYGGKRPIVTGTEQDRPFIEVAIASRAKYVVTEDQGFERFEDIAQEEGFKIVTPGGYLVQEGVKDP